MSIACIKIALPAKAAAQALQGFLRDRVDVKRNPTVGPQQRQDLPVHFAQERQEVQMRMEISGNQTAETGTVVGGYRFTTAKIVFSGGGKGAACITWQDYDVTPGFPRLRAFIDRWRNDHEHRVESVTVTDIASATMPACRIPPSSSAVH